MFLVLCFLLGVGGCSTPPVVRPATPVVDGTGLPVEIVIHEATPAPLPTDTASPSNTPTLAPTRTPTSTPTEAATPTRTRTPTPSRTLTKTPIPSGPITRIDTHLHSAALGEDRRVVIYLPPGYNQNPQRRYPVIYMLHGYGGFNASSPEWEQWGLKDKLEGMIDAGQIKPMIAVLPDGFMANGQPSYWFNHGPGTDGKRWGDYVWQDVVQYMDSNYRTIPRRESRLIAGFSLGGQGALSIGLLHPELFSDVGAHSPSFRGVDGPPPSIPFINDWNYFNQFDPIWLVQNKDAWRQLAIWMDVGANDDKVRNCGKNSIRCVEGFHSLLTSRGIPHEWHDAWPGPHEGVYWAAHLPDYLAWYSSKLVGL